jgi:4-hydroxy-tetrahydrodipicolinate synthase
LGGDGYIDGGGIGAPFAVPFFESFWSGDLDAARKHGRRWSELTRAWIEPDFGGKFGSPASQLKAAMRLLGQPGGEVRQPQLPLTDPAKLGELESVLRASGLLV